MSYTPEQQAYVEQCIDMALARVTPNYLPQSFPESVVQNLGDQPQFMHWVHHRTGEALGLFHTPTPHQEARARMLQHLSYPEWVAFSQPRDRQFIPATPPDEEE